MIHNSIVRAGWALIAVILLAGCSKDSPQGPSSNSYNPILPPGGGTGAALLEDFSSAQVLPTTNWWNLEVTTAPVDPNSQAIINWISGRTESNPTARQRLHPDMAPPPWGIPYIGVSGDAPLSEVTFTSYARESDAGAAVVPFYGARQAGIATPAQDRLVFGAFDLTLGSAAELEELLRVWTEAASKMTAGEPFGPAVEEPEAPPVEKPVERPAPVHCFAKLLRLSAVSRPRPGYRSSLWSAHFPAQWRCRSRLRSRQPCWPKIRSAKA
jgi:hypothetical protein